MKLPNHNPTQLTAWKELEAHFSAIQDQTILNLFETEKRQAQPTLFYLGRLLCGPVQKQVDPKNDSTIDQAG